eukprot:scaffold55597_cov68-Cyclotella_meneghiniana.AAC.4
MRNHQSIRRLKYGKPYLCGPLPIRNFWFALSRRPLNSPSLSRMPVCSNSVANFVCPKDVLVIAQRTHSSQKQSV